MGLDSAQTIIDIEDEQVAQNDRLDLIETDLNGIEADIDNHETRITSIEGQLPQSLAGLSDVQINAPLQDAQVLVNIGGLWGNYTIDIS